MDYMISLAESLGPLALNTLKALAVLIVGWSAAGFVSGVIRRRVNATPQIDRTIGNFIASIVRWGILLMVLVAILNLFGIEATSLVAVLGAATLAIGLALQGTLSDLASGFMLILFRPYKLDDFVEVAGTTGTVKDLNLFFTELSTPDNVQIIIPNGKAWGSVITNYSRNATRRLDIVFGIDYGDDPDQAMALVLDVVRADPRTLADPEPWIRVTNLGSSSVDLTLRVWCKSADLWELRFHLLQQVKSAFDSAGITIPYPHQVEISK